MSTNKVTKRSVLAAFRKADEGGQKTLIGLFGPDLFKKEGKVTDRVHTLKDACEELGRDYDKIFEGIEDPIEQARIAIETFAEAMREGKPASECFYYPYFYTSGGGFSYDDYAYDRDYSSVGARLRVDTPDKAKHMGKSIESYYKTYILGK